MGHSHYDPADSCRRAWNAGKKVGTKRPLKPRQIWAIRFFLDREQRLRDRALFDLTIDSKLRGCDYPGCGTGNPDTRDGHATEDGPTGSVRVDERRTLQPFFHGWNDVAGRWMTTHFQAGSIQRLT